MEAGRSLRIIANDTHTKSTLFTVILNAEHVLERPSVQGIYVQGCSTNKLLASLFSDEIIVRFNGEKSVIERP